MPRSIFKARGLFAPRLFVVALLMEPVPTGYFNAAL